MRKASSLKRCLQLAIGVFIADQISKFLVLQHVQTKTIPVISHLNLVLGYNKGAAFGLLSTAGGWQRWFFIGVVVTISLILMLWSKRLGKRDRLENFALGLILGGAWGNVCDRIRLGYVVDFIDFYIGNWHWYTFNVADSAICVGAVILALQTFKKL